MGNIMLLIHESDSCLGVISYVGWTILLCSRVMFKTCLLHVLDTHAASCYMLAMFQHVSLLGRLWRCNLHCHCTTTGISWSILAANFELMSIFSISPMGNGG